MIGKFNDKRSLVNTTYKWMKSNWWFYSKINAATLGVL
jgi:hypothetical protein